MSSVLRPEKDEWHEEYENAKELAQDIMATIQERNLKHRNNDGNVSKMTAMARRKLASMGTAIERLEAILNDPKRCSDVTENEVNRRRDMIRSLKTRREALMIAMKRDQNNEKKALLSPNTQMMTTGPPRETEVTAKLDDSELLSLQEQVMRQQDEDLSQIEKGVTTTKHVAIAINEELTLQEKLLDGLDDDVSVVHNRMQAANQKIKSVMIQASEWKWWCLLVFLIAAFIAAIAFCFETVFSIG